MMISLFIGIDKRFKFIEILLDHSLYMPDNKKS